MTETIANGSMKMPGYTVEARTTNGHAIIAAGQPIGPEWQTVRFEKDTPIGVPNDLGFGRYDTHGCYSYVAAQALRWWFAAVVDAERKHVETRLQEHLLEYTHRVTKVGPCDASKDGDIAGRNRVKEVGSHD